MATSFMLVAPLPKVETLTPLPLTAVGPLITYPVTALKELAAVVEAPSVAEAETVTPLAMASITLPKTAEWSTPSWAKPVSGLVALPSTVLPQARKWVRLRTKAKSQEKVAVSPMFEARQPWILSRSQRLSRSMAPWRPLEKPQAMKERSLTLKKKSPERSSRAAPSV